MIVKPEGVPIAKKGPGTEGAHLGKRKPGTDRYALLARKKKRSSPVTRGLLFLLVGMGLFSACTKEQDITLYLSPGDGELVQSLPPLPSPWRLKIITLPGKTEGAPPHSHGRADPLPSGTPIDPISPIDGAQGRKETGQGPTLEIHRLFQYEEPLFKERVGETYVVLASRVYAPRASVLDERGSLPLSEVLLRMAGNPETVVPLADITLPDKALKVDGLLPAEPGYPLIKKVVLLLRFPPAGAPSDGASQRLRGWFASLPRVTPPSTKVYTLAFVGDIMPGRGVDTILLENRRGLEQVFGDTLPLLLRHDLCLGNLEGALTEHAQRVPKSYNFKFPPPILPLLKRAGFAYLSLTNNHIYDYGEVGLLDTLKAFERYRMGTSGIGRTLAEATNPWWWPQSQENPPNPLEMTDKSPEAEAPLQKTVSHGKTGDGLSSQENPSWRIPGGEGPWLAVFSLGAYPREKNGFDGERLAAVDDGRPGILWAREEHLQALRPFLQEAPFSVVMVHGGTEWSSVPSKEQRSLYRRLIDEGADLVVGSHPHVIQGMEAYKGSLIAYSLGNFLFPGMGDMSGAQDSCILSVGIYEGKVRYVECIPVTLNDTGVRLEKGERIRRTFYELSRALQ